MNIGNAIKNLRLDNRVRQGDMAEALHITQGHLSLIENGHKKPSIDLLARVADYFKVPLPVLFWGGLSEKDVHPDKMEAYKAIKPTVDQMIKTLFSNP